MTKLQKITFGLLMSYTMAIGMEIYNIAFKMGFSLNPGGLSSMTNAVFPAALLEAAYMGVFVFLFSNLWGNRLGAKLAAKRVDPAKDNALLCRLTRQGCTVLVMCPTMSLTASILFSILLARGAWLQLPAIFVGTLIKNFPMALLWNVFAAAPFSRWIFGKLFPSARGI